MTGLKKFMCVLLVLYIGAAVFAEDEDQADNMYDMPNGQTVSGETSSPNPEVEKLKEEVSELKDRVKDLEAKLQKSDIPWKDDVSRLEERLETLQENEESPLSAMDIVLIVLVFILVVLLAALIFRVLKMKPASAKVPEERTPRPSISGYGARESAPPPPRPAPVVRNPPIHAPEANPVPPAGSTAGFQKPTPPAPTPAPAANSASPAPAPAPAAHPAPPAPASDLSALYMSKDARDKRKQTVIDDVYLDVDSMVYTRLSQGDNAQIVLEKGGNFISASFVLVDQKNLYFNFHKYNEKKQITEDMRGLTEQLFRVKGTFPGYIIKCEPAQMRAQDGGYVVGSKGGLELE